MIFLIKDFIDNPGGYLNKYFSTMSEAEADELAVKKKKNNITTAVESIHRRFYNDQHLFEYFNAYVDDHHDNIKSINDFISVEPEVIIEEILAMNESNEKIYNEQVFLYKKRSSRSKNENL
jgi:hypothetical protein